MKVAEKMIVTSPSDVVPELIYFSKRKVEHFGIVCLDGAHHMTDKASLFKGGYTSSSLDIRVLLFYAIKHRACSVILWHNHPSGSTIPSDLDIKSTKKIVKAFEVCGMQVLDHVVIGRDGYSSFLEKGLL